MSQLTPYLLWIKLGALALVIALSFGGGCKAQASRDAAKIAKKDLALRDAAEQLRVAAVALTNVSKNTEAEARKAAANQKAGRDAADAAQRDADMYKARAGEVERELAAANRDPECRKVLEMPTCASLR